MKSPLDLPVARFLHVFLDMKHAADKLPEALILPGQAAK